jgi:hypothetical protein
VKEINYDSLSNRELIDYIKTLGSAGVELSEEHFSDIWIELRLRLEAFMRIKNRIHKKYYGTVAYPCYNPSIVAYKMTGAYFYSRKNAKRFYIYVTCNPDSGPWTYGEYVRIEDFCNIEDFKSRYSKELKEKKLNYLDEAIEKTLVRLGALLTEQDNIKKEEGN